LWRLCAEALHLGSGGSGFIQEQLFPLSFLENAVSI